jgi:hypothetical protein
LQHLSKTGLQAPKTASISNQKFSPEVHLTARIFAMRLPNPTKGSGSSASQQIPQLTKPADKPYVTESTTAAMLGSPLSLPMQSLLRSCTKTDNLILQ